MVNCSSWRTKLGWLGSSIFFLLFALYPSMILLLASQKEDYEFIYFGKWNISRQNLWRMYKLLEQRFLLLIVILYCLFNFIELYYYQYSMNGIYLLLGLVFICDFLFPKVGYRYHFEKNERKERRLDNLGFFVGCIFAFTIHVSILIIFGDGISTLQLGTVIFLHLDYKYFLPIVFSLIFTTIGYQVIFQWGVFNNDEKFFKEYANHTQHFTTTKFSVIRSNFNKLLFNLLIVVLMFITNGVSLILIDKNYFIICCAFGGLALGGVLFLFITGTITDWEYIYGSKIFITRFKKLLPKKLTPFLDFTTQCILLHKTGGSYRFFHHSLLEHLANMDESKIEQLANQIEKRQSS